MLDFSDMFDHISNVVASGRDNGRGTHCVTRCDTRNF